MASRTNWKRNNISTVWVAECITKLNSAMPRVCRQYYTNHLFKTIIFTKQAFWQSVPLDIEKDGIVTTYNPTKGFTLKVVHNISEPGNTLLYECVFSRDGKEDKRTFFVLFRSMFK